MYTAHVCIFLVAANAVWPKRISSALRSKKNPITLFLPAHPTLVAELWLYRCRVWPLSWGTSGRTAHADGSVRDGESRDGTAVPEAAPPASGPGVQGEAETSQPAEAAPSG